MATIDTLTDLVAPIVAGLDADIYDIEYGSGVFRLTLDRPGGIDLDTIAEATRQISRQIDLDDPIPSKFTLEVTSPGLERTLRTPAHWATAIGDVVSVKMKPGFDGDRRVQGVLSAVDDATATLDVDGTEVRCPLDEVDRAKTVFHWGPQPKPGGPRAGQPKKKPAPSAVADAVNESENS
ncbi:MAG: ribosome maturation factor RimP [Acidimicrobiales bacterium]